MRDAETTDQKKASRHERKGKKKKGRGKEEEGGVSDASDRAAVSFHRQQQTLGTFAVRW